MILLAIMLHTCILFGHDSEDFVPRSPSFFTGERIKGKFLIIHEVTEEPIFDTVQLLLRGDVTITVNLKADIWRKTERPLLQMTCVKLAKDFRSSERSSRMRYISDFSFDMPETIMFPSLIGETNMKPHLHRLPPSIRIVQEATTKWLVADQNPTFGLCDVVYYIEARLFLKGRQVCGTSREIMVMPVAEIPPPIEPGDLKDEYHLIASSPLRVSRRRRQAMSISMSCSEPQPLLFDVKRAMDELPSTELLLRFSVQQLLPEDDFEIIAKPEALDFNLTLTLEATTYFLQHEENSVLSSAEVRDTPFSVVKTARFRPRKKKLSILSWKKVEGGRSDNSIEWIATASISAHLPPDAPKLPSFSSALVSRRHAFHMQAKIGSEFGTCLHNLRLKVPVAVVHAPLEHYFDEDSEDDRDVVDELEAPPYVP